jgi:VWFA-related protein
VALSLIGRAQPQAAPPVSVDASGPIRLDVVVNNRSGVPVTGLQQQDFTILDNKEPQPIRSFEAASGSAPAQIILILDAVNTSFSRVAFARTGMTKFLQQDGGKLSRPVSIGFFTDSGLQMQQTPSRDGNALVTFLNQHDTPLRSIRRAQGIYGAGDRMNLSLRALSQLAEVEAKIPERKVVIWLSPGWPLLSGPRIELTNKQEQDIFNTIVSTSTLLRQARVTLYAVDPSGTSDAGTFRTFYYEQFLKGVKLPKQVQFGDLSLQVLATQSGGRVLNSDNDIGGEIQHCVRDISASYLLTFDPRPADGPDDYHAIEVKIGKPDIKAQTRYGYYAQPAQPHGTH